MTRPTPKAIAQLEAKVTEVIREFQAYEMDNTQYTLQEFERLMQKGETFLAELTAVCNGSSSNDLLSKLLGRLTHCVEAGPTVRTNHANADRQHSGQAYVGNPYRMEMFGGFHQESPSRGFGETEELSNENEHVSDLNDILPTFNH